VEDAEALLQQALVDRPSRDAKGRALITLDLAACRVLDGDAAAAATLVTGSLELAREVVVAPIATRAREVVGAMMALDPTTATSLRDRLPVLA
ncbi:MAG: hypothetical protein ACRCYU_06105, partial [Nocardioides sp.]